MANSVRINPAIVEFLNVKAGEVYSTTITVTNTGHTSKRMRLLEPKSKLFTFRVINPETPIAAGLSLGGTLEFRPTKDEDIQDRLVLFLEDKAMDIPILAFPPACCLIMESFVDFGTMMANSQVVKKEVKLTNQGSAPGAFQVLCGRDPTITISPLSGVLQPGAIQWLKVELCTDKPRSVRQEAKVKLQNSEDVALRIQAEVVEQSLELQDQEGRSLSCIRFGPVFFGTSGMEKVVLVNNGPQACDWVVVLQEQAPGTEVGVDLQKSTDAVLLDRRVGNRVSSEDPSTVIQCVPNEGELNPNGKTTLWVYFSPVHGRSSSKEQGRSRASAHCRQDYCLFLKFEMVGIKDGFHHHSTVLPHNGHWVELAVTGTALPVSLVPSPGHSFTFQQCLMGEHVDVLCILRNFSNLLPVTFKFRKMANFISDPASGTVPAGQCQDVVLSFTPHQIGSFKVKQVLDVLGHRVHLDASCAKLRLHSFHTVTLHLSAVCRAQIASIKPKLNSGITPAVTNETGQYSRVPCSELGRCAGLVRAAVLSAVKTRLHNHSHNHHRSKSLDNNQCELVAFPNDRAGSLRPPSPDTKYRTIFTGVERYHYVDPDFAFTDEEEKKRQRHRDHYLTFIRSLRRARLMRNTKRLQDEVENHVDIGIRPAAGLLPPKLSLHDLESIHSQDGWSLDQGRNQLQTPCMLAVMEIRSTSRQVGQLTDGLNSVPTTEQEVSDCSHTLTAQQLHQVDIGPSTVDFGEVCVGSVCVRTLNLVNNLQMCVWVQLELDCCPELQRSSPLSHVLPPQSRASLPLVFECTDVGQFHKYISYKMNQRHWGQVLIQSHVVPVALQLTQSQVVLTPSPNHLAQSGYSGTVTLVNSRNRPADFSWRPIVTKQGMSFSIRPATGVVEAYRELDCEVVWNPSFFSPLEGLFDLVVDQGNTECLQCVAKLGLTSVHLAEKHLVFKSVPLNLPSVRIATLQNTGQNHAYFQVLDVYPLPGMTLTPTAGVVPVGGWAEVQVHLNPGAVMKFDTRVEIALRNMKSLELRVGGSVEPPLVDISINSFLFRGVHSGSSCGVPFCLTNNSTAQTRVQFDLSEQTDFSVQFPSHSGGRRQGQYWIDIPGQQTVECCLRFSPKQVAAYDFNLPVTINSVSRASSASTNIPRSSSSRAQHIVNHRSQPVTMASLSCRIRATVLRAPLEMSLSSLHFDLEPVGSLGSPTQTQFVELRNVSETKVVWRFDCTAAVPLGGVSSQGPFSISPTAGTLEPEQCVHVSVTVSTDTVDQLSVSIPLFLSDTGEEDWEKGEEWAVPNPYRVLSLNTSPHPPCISFLPPRVLLTPVPLDTPTTTTLSLLPTGYPSGSCLHVKLEEVVLEDGSRLNPLSISLPDNGTIGPQTQIPIPCTVTFCSSQPLALSSHITFLDHLNNRFQVEVCATADNSLLTIWPYLALHSSEKQIVLKSGPLSGGRSGRSEVTGKAVLHPRFSPSPLSRYTSSSSTFSLLACTSIYSVSDSVDESSKSGSPEPGQGLGSEGKENWPQRERDGEGERSGEGLMADQQPQSVSVFPEPDSEEGLYHDRVLQAVQKWFSQFGWPRAPNPISLPHTLRKAVCRTVGSCACDYCSKNKRTINDMLHHLSGQTLPGVNKSQSLPSTPTERVQQLIHQHTVQLDFLRIQGACLPHIRPEYLLDSQDFSHWMSLQSPLDQNKMGVRINTFELLSKRAWNDVLLQTYKVLVLPRVTESLLSSALQGCDRGSSEKQIPRINPEPLASNVYSTWERRLLTWLNLHYHSMRTIVWSPHTCTDVPSARWVVNFDLDLADGLILAAVLAAYCPFLISSHLQRMYTCSSYLEQNHHNNIILCQAFTQLRLDIDIQPTELSDPNPVQMLMLCVFLYERLPQYLPRTTITLTGSLHHTFTKQVSLKSSCSKPVMYHAFMVGEKAHLFSLPQGPSILIPPKGRAVELMVQYTCKFLRPMEAMLLLTSRSTAGPSGVTQGSLWGQPGVTLAFRIQTQVIHINPSGILKCKSPCYQQKELQLTVKNPFSNNASFSVVLVESRANPLQVEEEGQTNHKNLLRQVTNSGTKSAGTKTRSEGEEGEEDDDCGENYFFSPVKSVFLTAGQTDTIDIYYLPFHQGIRHCSVLLISQQVGELVYLVKGSAELPLPCPLTLKPSTHIVHLNSATSGGADHLLRVGMRCGVGSTLDEVVCIPLVNKLWERALATVGQRSMGPVEKQRRSLTHTLDSSSVRAGVATTSSDSQVVEYSVEVSLPEHFLVPDIISLPVAGDTQENTTEPEVVLMPLRFHAREPGRFCCQLVLRSWRDIRVHLLEAVVTGEGGHAQLEFTTPAHLSVTQDIPLTNNSSQDWRVRGVVRGRDFHGPPVVYIQAGEKVCYPLTFRPTTQSTVTGWLSLLNDSDGTEHGFNIRGVGLRPLPLDNMILHCPVGLVTQCTLQVPNYTSHPLNCQVD
ncbi:hypothetical protein DPEC_G00150910 [Dallia pectoralis]|uniref:Uncharacterized protein n=1 Tax=Dallia pectoralis TaxID=75939 RepID=A0ACC2GJH2_DALPE|nr:hypothetical protein DPEC_G00150910 [Dallia pectoralis]